MRKKEKVGGKFFWQLVSICFAICMWLFVIQVQDPTDSIFIKDIQVNVKNEEILDSYDLVYYGFDDTSVDVRIVGSKAVLGKLRKKNNKVVGTIDISDYLTDKKKEIDGETYLPLSIILPDSLKNDLRVDSQSVTYMKVRIDDRILEQRDVEVKINNSLSNEYYINSDRTKIMPQKVEISGAKELVDKIDKVYAEINVSLPKDEIYNADIVIKDKEDNIIEGLKVSPAKVQIQVNVLNKKAVKLGVEIGNSLIDEYELEELKIMPSEIMIAGTSDIIKSLDNNLNIPMDIEQKEGSFTQKKSVSLSDNLVNIDDVSEVEISYKIKKNKSNNNGTNNNVLK